jgi:hypothetical protein
MDVFPRMPDINDEFRGRNTELLAGSIGVSPALREIVEM